MIQWKANNVSNHMDLMLKNWTSNIYSYMYSWSNPDRYFCSEKTQICRKIWAWLSLVFGVNSAETGMLQSVWTVICDVKLNIA